MLDIRASSSLMTLELHKKELTNNKENKNNERTRKIGVGEFMSNGIVAIENVTLPALTTQRELNADFILLPECANYSCHFIAGAKNLREIGISMHLKDNSVK